VRAIGLRVRTTLARRWWVTLAVVAAVAVPTAAVLTLTVNARRVATFPERFTEAVGGDGDAVVVQPAGPPLTDDIGALPTVRDAESLTFVFAEPTEPTPTGDEPEVNVFGITDPRAAGAIVMSGRSASPDVPNEFVANRAFVRAYDLDIGDRVSFATASQPQVDAAVVLNEEPEGPTIDGLLVGVVDGPAHLDDPTATVFFPSTLLEQPVGIVATLIAVKLTAGTSLDDFRASLDALPGHEQLFFQPGRVVSDSARDTFRAQAVGSAILAAVAGLATVAAVGQLLLRQRAAGAGERRALLPLGYTGRQSAVEGIAWAAAVVSAGVVAGALGSILLTPLVPRGFARRLDPEAGEVLLDPFIAIGAVVLALALIGWVAVGVLLSRPATAERPSSAADTLARGLRPETATGVRFAFARGRNGRSALVTTTALAVAIAAMLGSAVFASNIDALTADPARYGSDFDYITGNSYGTGEPQPWPAVETLDGLAAASFVATGSALLEEQDVDVVGYEPVRGSLLAPVLAGSFPVSADELAIGRMTARELGVHEGDEVTLTGGSGATATYRVVGQAVLPNPSFGLGGGHGVAMLLSGWRRLEPDAEPNSLMIDLEPGASVPDELQPFSPQTAQTQTRPTDVVNLDRSRSVPNLLAVVIGVLAMLTLGHALLLSVRQRRRELAVLRSLGADRRWVGRTVHAQASALTVAALVVGIPTGLVGGRLLFRAFVDRLGLVPDPITPGLLVLLLAVGVLVVANVAAAVPARRARDTPVAALLHSE
jgi:hypothetical protein